MTLWIVFKSLITNSCPQKMSSLVYWPKKRITNEQYQHAQQVWDTFKMKSMGKYHDLYLKSDVLLLADVFENFRSTYLQYYKLDPAYYFTSPALAGVQCLVKLMNSWNFSVNSHLLKYVSLCNDLRTNLLSNHADDTWLTVVIIALHYHCYKL